MAGGRVWTSAGIARASGEFEVERPYRLCKACNHPEICNFMTGSDLLQQLRRATASADGHLPSAEGLRDIGRRAGRAGPGRRPAPCAADRRSPAGDQRTARGLRRERCRKRDHRFSACLSGAWQPGLAGELFVVNRGPKGFGYWRCRRCEYAVAATEPKNLHGDKAKHNDPRSGTECPSKTLSWPVHLGYLFRTDVRQIRLGRPLPRSDEAIDQDETRESFVRSLVEAVRLHAADLLELTCVSCARLG